MHSKIICSRCVLDDSVPEIEFDAQGVCNYCQIHDALAQEYPSGPEGEEKLSRLVDKIKHAGKNKRYDCLIGVSGGTDSTYTLYLMKSLGLNPLAVHFDNGWNSEIAVNNIKHATNILGIDLYTHVADWEEFKDLQISFLKSSTPDAEIPTDYVIISVLLAVAAKEGIKYVIEGQSFRAEGTTPTGWTYHDGFYVNSVHRKFGKKKLKSFPILSVTKLIYYFFVKRIKFVRPLEFVDYSKKMARDVNASKLKWQDPGGHHHESLFTKFFQSYYLPKKFNIDKRKRELSAQIRSDLISREDALRILEKPYAYDEDLVEYVIQKLGLSKMEFAAIMQAPIKSFLDYPTLFPLIRLLRYPIKIACKLHIFPPIFYLKYGSDIGSKIKNHWAKFNRREINI